MEKMEVWGNLESSLMRIGDDFVGSERKFNLTDEKLTRIKNLGISRIFYTCHWENLTHKSLDHIDWASVDEDLHLLRKAGLEITVSFLNHGSGPFFTSLIDPDFPFKLQTFARHFARRFPWITQYNPINDMNLTAKRSCLEGKWYPHLKDELYYLKALIHQCKATVLAMKEIRAANPQSEMILTENIGKWDSSEELLSERDFENERRWLSLDILLGKIHPLHPLFKFILKQGIREEELQWFAENTISISCIGLNLDLENYRYLDHKTYLYPESVVEDYRSKTVANISAVDTGQASPISVSEIIEETHHRYQLPMAITSSEIRFYPGREAHMRWLAQIWEACKKSQEKEVHLKAVTSSHLLDLFLGKTTGLGNLIQDLSSKGYSEIPVLQSEGVWETSRRIHWAIKEGEFTRLYHKSVVRPILIVGHETALGEAFARVCGERNIAYKTLKRREMDITDKDSIEQALEVYKPWAIVNAAGQIRIDENPMQDSGENVASALNLAQICKERRISLVNFSSELTYEGKVVAPKNVYGKTRIETEKEILGIYPESLIIRTSAFFGPWDEMNFVTRTLRTLAQNNEVIAPNDVFISPTYVPDLINECLNLLIDGATGIVHLSNAGEVSWQELATLAATTARAQLQIDPNLIKGVPTREFELKMKRSENFLLRTEFLSKLPSLEDALDRYLSELKVPIITQQEIRQ